MKPTTQAKKINEKIQAIVADHSTVACDYNIIDNSVQTGLRLSASWDIRFPVDYIKRPKCLAPHRPIPDPWSAAAELGTELMQVARLATGRKALEVAISARTKTGPERREEAKALFEIEQGRTFLAAHRKATGKRILAGARKKIVEIQAKQKALIKEMRRHNGQYLAERKAAKAAERQAAADALAEGRFWDASPEALKGYFNPPFSKNHLADMSETWRAALFLECESTGWKDWHGNWRHKLVGTGDAYLCGIDDNVDEWGHRCSLNLGCDQHGNTYMEASVEDAMSELFGIPASKLHTCERQGDLLFCGVKLRTEPHSVCSTCGSTWNPWRPDESCHYLCEYCQNGTERVIPPIELHPHYGPWEIRESHRVESDGLERNGQYFRSPNPIEITHTSHQAVTLDPGEYRLYELQVYDAD